MKVLQVNIDDNTIAGLYQMICRILRKKPEDMVMDAAFVYPFKDESRIRRLEKYGAAVYDIGAYGKRFGKMMQVRKNLTDLLIEEGYDIVHIHSNDAYEMRMLAAAAKKAGVPKIILHVHAAQITGRYNLLKTIRHKILCRALVMYGTEFASTSEASAKWMFPNIDDEDMIRIRDGISTAAYHFDETVRERIRDELDIPEKAMLIGNVSPFDHQSNHEFMMDVLAELMTKKPETMMLLVGDGALLKEVKQESAAYGLSKNIIFYKGGKINELMQAMDAFIFPGSTKDFSPVILQAQAAGLPTFLSEQVPEEAKVIDTVEFLPVKKESELVWAEHIRKRRVTPKKRMQGAARMKRAGYGIARTIKSYVNLYQLDEEDTESEEE